MDSLRLWRYALKSAIFNSPVHPEIAHREVRMQIPAGRNFFISLLFFHFYFCSFLFDCDQKIHGHSKYSGGDRILDWGVQDFSDIIPLFNFLPKNDYIFVSTAYYLNISLPKWAFLWSSKSNKFIISYAAPPLGLVWVVQCTVVNNNRGRV